MNKQEIFDKVVAHLLKQGAKSEDGMQCRYRGPDGLMCAVGCMIPDECYTPAMEGAALSAFGMSDLKRKSRSNKKRALADALECAGLTDDGVYTLLRDLQRMHDTRNVDEWRNCLRTIAESHNLTA